jgi:hypothetical protein
VIVKKQSILRLWTDLHVLSAPDYETVAFGMACLCMYAWVGEWMCALLLPNSWTDFIRI